jgi:hypothetical protein
MKEDTEDAGRPGTNAKGSIISVLIIIFHLSRSMRKALRDNMAFFGLILPASNAQTAVTNIFWPSPVSAGTSARRASKAGG